MSATLLLAHGVHPKIVHERLGHADISMTDAEPLQPCHAEDAAASGGYPQRGQGRAIVATAWQTRGKSAAKLLWNPQKARIVKENHVLVPGVGF